MVTPDCGERVVKPATTVLSCAGFVSPAPSGKERRMDPTFRSRDRPGEAPPHGHAHFWERAFARDQFIRTAALATGAVAGATSGSQR